MEKWCILRTHSADAHLLRAKPMAKVHHHLSPKIKRARSFADCANEKWNKFVWFRHQHHHEPNNVQSMVRRYTALGTHIVQPHVLWYFSWMCIGDAFCFAFLLLLCNGSRWLIRDIYYVRPAAERPEYQFRFYYRHIDSLQSSSRPKVIIDSDAFAARNIYG